jgi:hypothetical protein
MMGMVRALILNAGPGHGLENISFQVNIPGIQTSLSLGKEI